MEERRHSGETVTTEGATMKDIERALADVRNRAVTLHRPGSKVERWENGVRHVYLVSDEGKLVPVLESP